MCEYVTGWCFHRCTASHVLNLYLKATTGIHAERLGLYLPISQLQRDLEMVSPVASFHLNNRYARPAHRAFASITRCEQCDEA